MKPGIYTLSISLNSGLGKLISKRDVTVTNAVRPDGLTDAAMRAGVKPGEKRRLLPLKAPNDPGDKLSAVATWVNTKTSLVFTAEVDDACFSIAKAPTAATDGSCIELSISPLGGASYTSLWVVPDGQNGTARLEIGQSVKAKAFYKRTAKGYVMTVNIPWKSLPGYNPKWEAILVQAQVNTKTPNGRACVNTSKGGRMSKPETYEVLRRT